MTYQKRAPEDASTSVAGSADAAQIRAELRSTFALYYDVAASSDDIKIEVSKNGSDWREHPDTVASGSVTTGGAMVNDIVVAHQFVRAYPASGFADSDVTTVELVGKGD